MNTVLKTLVLIFFAVAVRAQAPNSFHYQAVLRDPSGNPLASKTVSFRMSILHNSATGKRVYGETHSVTTNEYGVADIQVGAGTPVGMTTLANLNWQNFKPFLRVEVDITGGTMYEHMGTSQLLSVPYALHAKTAENGFSGEYKDLKNAPDLSLFDKSITNEIQVLTRSGNTVTLSRGGGSFVLPTYTAGSGITISSTNRISVAAVARVNIGDIAHGGVVFYVNSTGTHGLVLNQRYQGTTNWYEAQNVVTNPTLTGGEFTDWRLPSLAECQLIQRNLVNAGKITMTTSKHWTGTETTAKADFFTDQGNSAYNFSFNAFNFFGSQTFQDPKSSNFLVRSVRSF